MNMLERGPGVLVLLLLVSCLLILLVHSPNAFAQSKKMSGTGRVVAVLSETKMLPGDDPQHEMTFLRRLDVQNGTLGEAQVTLVNVSDSVGGSGTDRGHLVSTFSDGDKRSPHTKAE